MWNQIEIKQVQHIHKDQLQIFQIYDAPKIPIDGNVSENECADQISLGGSFFAIIFYELSNNKITIIHMIA